jgi:hypothetical protein
MGSLLKAEMSYMFWLLHDWKHFYWFMWLSFYLFLNFLSVEQGAYWSTSQDFIALLETVNNVYNMVENNGSFVHKMKQYMRYCSHEKTLI